MYKPSPESLVNQTAANGYYTMDRGKIVQPIQASPSPIESAITKGIASASSSTPVAKATFTPQITPVAKKVKAKVGGVYKPLPYNPKTFMQNALAAKAK